MDAQRKPRAKLSTTRRGTSLDEPPASVYRRGKPWPGQGAFCPPSSSPVSRSRQRQIARTTYDQRYPVFDSNDRTSYEGGYRDGRESGVDDARRGRSYDVTRHGEYRDNRRGKERQPICARSAPVSKPAMTKATGCTHAAIREAATVGVHFIHIRLRRPRVPRPPPVLAPTADATPSVAADNGYRDGLEEGQHAAQHGDRFNPVSEKRYRDGDHNYKKQYGTRDEYQREYRAAFQQDTTEGIGPPLSVVAAVRGVGV